MRKKILVDYLLDVIGFQIAKNTANIKYFNDNS